jgi:hypothetical protein
MPQAKVDVCEVRLNFYSNPHQASDFISRLSSLLTRSSQHNVELLPLQLPSGFFSLLLAAFTQRQVQPPGDTAVRTTINFISAINLPRLLRATACQAGFQTRGNQLIQI